MPDAWLHPEPEPDPRYPGLSVFCEIKSYLFIEEVEMHIRGKWKEGRAEDAMSIEYVL
jgi:hypothetical protein